MHFFSILHSVNVTVAVTYFQQLLSQLCMLNSHKHLPPIKHAHNFVRGKERKTMEQTLFLFFLFMPHSFAMCTNHADKFIVSSSLRNQLRFWGKGGGGSLWLIQVICLEFVNS